MKQLIFIALVAVCVGSLQGIDSPQTCHKEVAEKVVLQIGLRPLRKADEEFLRSCLTHPAVIKMTGQDASDSYVTLMVDTPSDTRGVGAGLVVDFVIIDTALGKPVGWIGVEGRNGEFRVGELAYTIHPDYWNQGYASAALELMKDKYLSHGAYHKLRARIRADNHGSRRVVEKHGFVLTRVFPVRLSAKETLDFCLYEIDLGIPSYFKRLRS